MAASVTHLVIGEMVISTIVEYSHQSDLAGHFLAGCILVDLHAFQPIDRRITHFVGRVEEDGEVAFHGSCLAFINQLDKLLRRPWSLLPESDQAFVAGYLCHLAADECWKKLGWQMFQSLRINSWEDFPIPGDVSLTAFDYLVSQQSPWFENAIQDLKTIQIPDVFATIPHFMFIRQWEVIRDYVLAGGSPSAFTQMLKYAGKSEEEVLCAEERHQFTFDKAVQWYATDSKVGDFLQEAVQHSIVEMRVLLTSPRSP